MKRQYYGISFPFTNNNEQGYILDLNITTVDKTRADFLHLLLTPKGQRLRDPEFGTDLIKFIYDQNDSLTWENVRSEINKAVSKYLPYVSVKNLEVAQDEVNEFAVYVKVEFEVRQGNNVTKDAVAIKI